MSASRSYSFGEYRLDLARGALLKSGADVKLRPKSFEVLRLLIERHGQLVTKDELLDAVWGHTVVTEDSIFQCLIDVRRAIGDESQQMIKTVPRRGYIFDVPVTVSDAASHEYGVTVSDIAAPEREAAGRSSAPSRPQSGPRLLRSGLLAAAFISLVPVVIWWGLEGRGKEAAPPVERSAAQAPHNSIAVLPFVDLSPAGDSAYFSDGLSEEVLNLLSQTPELRVIARTSSFSFRDRGADIATIARTLGVRYLLEGSVRREGRRVRITTQLIEASSSTHLWSAVYERELDDVFAVQIEIAAAVADALETQLASSTRPAIAAPADPRAHDEVLRGQFFYHRRGPGDLERALRSFERAVALDANYARAWAGVAGIVCIETGDGRMPRATGLPRLLEAATRTVALDPRMAAGHFRLACYYDLLGEERLAEDHLHKALTLEPDNPLMLGVQAGSAARQGRFDEAIDLQRRAVARDPVSAVTISNLGQMLYAAGRFEEARVELTRAIELSPGLNAGTLGQILVLQHRFDAALAFIEQSAPGPAREQGLALVYHAVGRTAKADAALARLTALSATADPFRLAEVYAYRGVADESFRWLEIAARPIDREGRLLPGARDLWEMRASPFLAPLHADPRWAAWVSAHS